MPRHLDQILDVDRTAVDGQHVDGGYPCAAWSVNRPMERESSRRRWPAAAITLAAIAITALGVGAGAARSSADAASTAAELAASGRFGQAIALDDAIATRTGPIYLLDRT